jgi:uncharacterized protein (DUF2141 family)
MKYFFSLFIISFIILYFLAYCASITPPGGGPRDTIPPVLVKSYPENKSLNFKDNYIQLTYDEYLKIDNLTKQLIITPIIQEEFEQKIRKNSIELSFSEPFDDSTTYTFNFGEAIQDITEGNITYDNVLAFSTGDYIDSLYLNGRVDDLLTNQRVENYTVCLYVYNDTLDIFNSPPLYLTRTTEDGKYLIENIKNGIYRLYVYNDANSNFMCDIPREMFGFQADTINLYGNIDSIFLKVQYLDMREIEIQRAGNAGKYFEIKTNKNITDYTVTPIDSTKTIYHNFGEDNKTIRFYDNIHTSDSVQFIFSATDSLDNLLVDTLYLKFIESKRDLEEFSIIANPKNKSKITDQFRGVIEFSKPITNINFDSLYFEYDSVTFQYLSDTIEHSLNNRNDIFSFGIQLFYSEYLQNLIKSDSVTIPTNAENTLDNKKLGSTDVSKSKLLFHMGKGAFISADMDTSKAAILEYQLLRPESYGIIKGNVDTEFNSFTIQLLKGRNEIVKEISNDKQYEFTNVDPGNYFIRVFIDNNSNGKWDPGNIFENIEPEGIYFFPEEITIRANWELTDINLVF